MYSYAILAESALISNRWKQFIFDSIDESFIERLGKIYDISLSDIENDDSNNWEEINSNILNILITTVEEIPKLSELVARTDLFYYALNDLRKSNSLEIIWKCAKLLKTVFLALDKSSNQRKLFVQK